MIRYALKCSDAHSFESWFKSSEAFDSLRAAGLVACPICDATDVQKAIMAPPVRASRKAAVKPDAPDHPVLTPTTDAERAVAELRRKVQENSDYVGPGFAAEARKMHVGDIPHRSIYGEANLGEAKQLIEDGIPVAPLPFIPQRKTN
jgi:hypothetical protein